MKATLVTSLFLFCLAATTLHGSPIARELVERAVRLGGGEVLERQARATAELAATRAMQRFGRPGAEAIIDQGGLSLLQAGARHGDVVWDLVQRVPAAARYVGAQPERALDLARRLGDEALMLEARLPGAAESAARLFGRERLPVLAQTPSRDVQRLLGFAEQSTDPALHSALWDRWLGRGARLLDELDKHKKLILTGGLTMAMLDLAFASSDAVGEVGLATADTIRQMPPEAMQVLASEMGRGVKLALALGVALLTACPLAWLLIRSRRPD